MWTIVFHERKPPGPHQGFAAGREQAMAAFQGELGARAILTAKEHHIAQEDAPAPRLAKAGSRKA